MHSCFLLLITLQSFFKLLKEFIYNSFSMSKIDIKYLYNIIQGNTKLLTNNIFNITSIYYMEVWGLEPQTYGLQSHRSSQLSYTPFSL